MKKRLTAAVLSALMLFMSANVFAAGNEAETEESAYSGEYNAFEQIAEYVADRYIDESLTKEEIMAQGLSKMLEGNDPLLVELLKATLESMDDYSEFYTAEEYREYQNSLNSTFYSIGITMKMADDGYVEITGFAEENSSAEKAGFKIGDKIYKVNGVDMTGLDIEEVCEHVIGEEGTSVNITVLRDSQEINLTTTRVAVHGNTVSAGILEGNIGYIQITSFSVRTAAEFLESLEAFREKEVKKIILDLRNNGGGFVSAAVEIAQMIVPKGKIIDVKFRESEYDATYESKLAKKEFDFAVLVNENTASAAEILASAIQDSGAGKLVGMTTFGKAVIQNTYPLTNGSVFKLTTGQYITRNGKEINKVGLTPDKVVENVIEKIDTSEYTQFDLETRTAFGESGDNVKAAKERLSLLGLYTGDTQSNVFDEELRSAVRDYQKVHSLLPYGILDIATQASIDETFSLLETMTDKQLETAYEMLGGKIEDIIAE